MPFRFNSRFQLHLGLFRFFNPHGTVVEFFGGQFPQGLFQGRFGLGNNAVVFKEGAGADGGENQVGVLDVVKHGDVHIHKKTVRGLDVRGPVFAGRRCGGLRKVGQLQHLNALGQAIHLLQSEGQNERQAGVINLF